MRKRIKLCFTILVSFIVILYLFSGCSFDDSKLDFSNFFVQKLITNEHQLDEQYQNISVITDTAEVIFIATTDSYTSVVCNEQENAKHSVTVKDNTLLIELIDTREWNEYISIFTEATQITIYLPQSEYDTLTVKDDTGNVTIPENLLFQNIDIEEHTGNVTCNASASESVKIKTTTGNIQAENITASTMDLAVSTGNITASNISCTGDITVNVSTGKTKLANIQCGNFYSTGDTGKISLENVISSGRFSIERSTGEVEFDQCDAGEVSIKTDTGDVEGSFLSDKIFIVETDTGDVDIPKSTTGGKCEITTDTGDIEITIQ